MYQQKGYNFEMIRYERFTIVLLLIDAYFTSIRTKQQRLKYFTKRFKWLLEKEMKINKHTKGLQTQNVFLNKSWYIMLDILSQKGYGYHSTFPTPCQGLG